MSINSKSGCVAAFTPHFVFSATGAAKKHFVSEKPPNKRFFKNAGVVLAGIECSPKIYDFRANGILGLERVKKVDTLKIGHLNCPFVAVYFYIKI